MPSLWSKKLRTLTGHYSAKHSILEKGRQIQTAVQNKVQKQGKENQTYDSTGKTWEDTTKNKQRQTHETKGCRTKYKAHEMNVYQNKTGYNKH